LSDTTGDAIRLKKAGKQKKIPEILAEKHFIPTFAAHFPYGSTRVPNVSGTPAGSNRQDY